MSNDENIVRFLDLGILKVNPKRGVVFAPRSNTPLKPLGAKNRKGYLRTCIRYHGDQYYFLIHRIVWVSVNGPLSSKKQIDHLNTIKTDNRIENIEEVSLQENMRRGVRCGAFVNNGSFNKVGALRNNKGQFTGKKAAGRLLDGEEWHQMPEGMKV